MEVEPDEEKGDECWEEDGEQDDRDLVIRKRKVVLTSIFKLRKLVMGGTYVVDGESQRLQERREIPCRVGTLEPSSGQWWRRLLDGRFVRNAV